jgi:hypothetical protein
MADSVAKLTVASLTPGTFIKARSTRETHDAQVMPVTGKTQSREALETGAGLMNLLILAAV